ncbi:hypothetical protein J6590_076051 [Homalodisca vitripennis]|nr:hypothetical protein J6590_076051 [Homalodisca vitripennis]
MRLRKTPIILYKMFSVGKKIVLWCYPEATLSLSTICKRAFSSLYATPQFWHTGGNYLPPTLKIGDTVVYHQALSNLGFDFRTTTNGRAGGLLVRTGSLSGHPSKQQNARRCLIRLSCDNRCTRYAIGGGVPNVIHTEGILATTKQRLNGPVFGHHSLSTSSGLHGHGPLVIKISFQIIASISMAESGLDNVPCPMFNDGQFEWVARPRPTSYQD